MFGFLIIIGIIFTGIGIKKLKSENIDPEIPKKINFYKEVEKLYLLEKRVAQLEKLYVGILDEKKRLYGKADSQERYAQLLEYEEQGFSIDEIVEIMQLSKGEILLLKSLYEK